MQRLQPNDLAAQGHGGLQAPTFSGLGGVVGRAAVARDAQTHPIGAAMVAQGGRAVAQGALAAEVGGGGLEQRHLVGNALGAIGVAEVGHVRDFFHLRQGLQARPGRAVGLWGKAQAVHAAVELQEHAVALLGFVRSQPVDLFAAMHRVPELQARAQLQVARLEHAFEQEDGAAPTQRAHAAGLVHVEQGKAVGAAHAVKTALDAVAVGVGFDHRPEAGVGRGLARPGLVVAQGVEVNGGEDRAWHG